MTKAKSLKKGRKRHVGRSKGRVTTRHKGGGVKRLDREVDFKRDKRDIPAKIEAVEYDPNRSADLALLVYKDGERKYILLPEGLKEGDEIISSEKAPVKPGNALALKNVPVGTEVHNVELMRDRGAQMVRAAGSAATVTAREGGYVHLKMPSGEVRKVREENWATIGRVAGSERKLRNFSKAGTKRRLGVRPTVRGTAQHPGSHPHGGGEGRTGTGRPPKTPWGKTARGKKTRKRRHTDKYIVKDRRKK